MEEKNRIPPRMNIAILDAELEKIGQIITRLTDKEIFPWLESGLEPTDTQVHRAATIVADRLCGALADPIIRFGSRTKTVGIDSAVAGATRLLIH